MKDTFHACKETNVNKAIDLIIKELDKLKNTKISKNELKDSKTNLTNILILSSEDNSDIAQFYGDTLAFDEKMINFTEYINKIDNVTINDIYKLSNTIFNYNKMMIIKIGKKNFKV